MKRLLLIGGGHSHIEVVRRLRDALPPGAEVALASTESAFFYSGMLPGVVAGHYRPADCRIDLERLCRSAGVRFLETEAVGLDPAAGIVRFRNGDSERFDIVSLDVGSQPDATAVPGAAEHALPVKPPSRLLEWWETALAAARRQPQTILVVGGGAGGVELALAMERRLRAEGTPAHARIAIATDGPSILPSHPAAARRWFTGLFAGRGIRLHVGSRVAQLTGRGAHLENGGEIPARWVVWATSAAAPDWLAASGLAGDKHGFVAVDESLRSISHAAVFAAGDCAAFPRPLAKSGVHAVRQGPLLARNLCNALAVAPLERYAPQRRTLAIISSGERHAVATWGRLAFRGAWVWRWKDRIDRRFVAKYR